MNELKQKKALLNPPTFNQMLLGPEQAGKDTISYKIKSYTYPLPFEKKSRLYSILFEAIQSNALSTLPLQDKVQIIDYVVEKKVYSFQLISDFFKSALSSSDFVGFDLAPNQDNILYVSSFTQGNIVEFEINKNLNLYSVLVEMIESSWQMNSNPLIHSIKIL
ncbi:MAG: hypothetical protein GW760_08520 [Legionella sp.]|nr:hypothetical protein [Legionella sp.]